MSISVEANALNELKNILSAREIEETTLRIFVAGMSCSGPQFNLSVDERKDDDLAHEEDGYTFIIEKGLVDEFGAFQVKYFEQDDQKGIYIEPEIPVQSGCSGCSGGCN